jgi:CheY-like chemotaxis protein/signal transduction histidine kinase
VPFARSNREIALRSAIVLALALVLFWDTRVPLGLSVWVFYLVPLGAAVFSSSPAVPVAAAALATAFTVIGFYASPPGADPAISAPNRSMGVLTYWVVTVLSAQVIRARQALAREDWIRGGVAGLATELQGELSATEVVRRALRYLAQHLGADVGAAYVREDDGAFCLRATHGVKAGSVPERFEAGDGLLGTIAVEARPREFPSVPPGELRIATALAERRPAEIVAGGARADGEVYGAVELASVAPFRDGTLDLLDGAGQRIGVAVRSARYRERLQALLEETQRQAEQLQAQQEELRVSNEELQAQAEVLRASQARLEEQQAELEQTNAQLEEQSAQLEAQRATLEERSEALRLKAVDLERANRFKSEFLANMSHELRTPLNSALILSKLLSENASRNLTEEQVRWATTIHQAGADLLALINDVLDLARVEAGRLEVHPERVRPAALVDQLARMFEPVGAQRGLAFERGVDPAVPEAIVTDPQRLTQVLQNLLSNAFKFTERGGVTLRVALEGGRVAFSVADTGVGIPAEKQELVFEAFRQADGATNRRYGGTGLGLAISRDLARLLGGELRLESAPGRGSTFTLLLPRELSPAEAARSASAAAAAPAVASGVPRAGPPPAEAPGAAAVPAPGAAAVPAPGVAAPSPAPAGGPAPDATLAARRVLVVEDDDRFAGVLCDLARELHFEPERVASGQEALARAGVSSYAGIVLDVGLPDATGLTVLDRLKRDPRTRHVPVHVVSVHDYSQTALEMGAVGYVLKPVQREELVAAFRRIEDRLDRRVRTVLLVEDDPGQQEALGALLGGAGIDTEVAGTIAEGLARIRAGGVDCVVLDLTLPDGSGLDLLERMDGDPGTPFPPVIVYTGRALGADEEQRLRRHSRSIIVKGARSTERLLDEVTLFLHQVEAELPEAHRRMLQAARSREAVFEGRRVLLVEDDVRNVFAVTALLEPRGLDVRVARNGREALEALERGPRPDLVLMDIMMPEMDGHEAIRRIRADAAIARIPIIALTARAMADDRARALDAGANDYLAKPVDPERLLSLLRVWMPR